MRYWCYFWLCCILRHGLPGFASFLLSETLTKNMVELTFIASLPSGIWGCCHEWMFWLSWFLWLLLPFSLSNEHCHWAILKLWQLLLFIFIYTADKVFDFSFLLSSVTFSVEQNLSRWQPLVLLLPLCNFLVHYSMTIQLSSFNRLFLYL